MAQRSTGEWKDQTRRGFRGKLTTSIMILRGDACTTGSLAVALSIHISHGLATYWPLFGQTGIVQASVILNI